METKTIVLAPQKSGNLFHWDIESIEFLIVTCQCLHVTSQWFIDPLSHLTDYPPFWNEIQCFCKFLWKREKFENRSWILLRSISLAKAFVVSDVQDLQWLLLLSTLSVPVLARVEGCPLISVHSPLFWTLVQYFVLEDSWQNFRVYSRCSSLTRSLW